MRKAQRPRDLRPSVSAWIMESVMWSQLVENPPGDYFGALSLFERNLHATFRFEMLVKQCRSELGCFVALVAWARHSAAQEASKTDV